MSSSRRWGISKQTLREKPFLISQMWGKETLPSKDKFFILINIEEKRNQYQNEQKGINTFSQ